jgi:GNAT superfamily N-acetyltransferase
MLRIHEARTAEELEHARLLFLEYAEWLAVPLDFQNFDAEVAGLPGDYAPPRGRLLLASDDGELVGCVALHAWDDVVCEMKRLYVRRSHRGRGVGRALVARVIEEARAAGYRAMRLDSLSARMHDAVTLYRRFGFVEIAPYRHNPHPDTVYLELALSTRAR